MRQTIVRKAELLSVPYVSVDIGQLETGEWIVIEVGDPQFSGISQIPLLELWNNIKIYANGY